VRPTDELSAIEWLVSEMPELRPVLDEHVADNDEVLSYPAFADFMRWLVDRVRAGDHAAASRFVAAVESLMTTSAQPPASDPVWNLAGVEFVESLAVDPDWKDVVPTIREWMCPRTAADFDSYRADR
jgi:hypothetical protein